MDENKINLIIEAVIKELGAARPVSTTQADSDLPPPTTSSQQPAASLQIDLPDPTLPEQRYRPRVRDPRDPEALKALIASTTARIGVGRAGPHYNTFSLLLFQGDHA